MTVFRPAREAEVIVIHHVMEIYGGEGGWGALTYYGYLSRTPVVCDS